VVGGDGNHFYSKSIGHYALVMEASSKHHCPAPVASLFCGGLMDVCRLSLPEGPALTLLIMPQCQLHLTQALEYLYSMISQVHLAPSVLEPSGLSSTYVGIPVISCSDVARLGRHRPQCLRSTSRI